MAEMPKGFRTLSEKSNRSSTIRNSGLSKRGSISLNLVGVPTRRSLAVRLPANYDLERNTRELLKRPMGRPSYKPVERTRAFSTMRPVGIGRGGWCRRSSSTVGVFPRVRFIVTNLTPSDRAVVRFNDKRGTAEQRIKEGKQAVT